MRPTFLLILILSISYPCVMQTAARLHLTVTDKAGKAVTDISPRDLDLSESSTQLKITGVESVKERPVAALILLDNSISQKKVFSAEKKIAQAEKKLDDKQYELLMKNLKRNKEVGEAAEEFSKEQRKKRVSESNASY